MNILEGFNSTLPIEGELPTGISQEEVVETSEKIVSDDVVKQEEIKEQTEELADSEELPEDPKSRNAAFAKMRVERREAEQKASNLERRLAELEGIAKGRQELQEEIKSSVPAEKEVAPDRYDDPEAYDKYLIKQAQEEIRAEYGDKFSKIEDLEKQAKAAQQIQLINQAKDELDVIKSEYLKVDPSFTEARAYLIKSISSELRDEFPDATDMQIKQEVERLELESASSYFRKGQNPAQMQVKIAKNRGFKPSGKVTKSVSNGRTNSFIGKTGATIRGENPTINEGNEMDLAALFANKEELEKSLREGRV